jgi:hypothetical protein
MNSAMPPPAAEALGAAFRTPTVKGGVNFGFVPQESLFFAVGTRQKVVHKPSKIFFSSHLAEKEALSRLASNGSRSHPTAARYV